MEIKFQFGMISKIESLQAELEALRKEAEEIKLIEKELMNTMRSKETELRKIILQKKLSYLNFP